MLNTQHRARFSVVEHLEERRLLSVNSLCREADHGAFDLQVYESDVPATFRQGDWNGNHRFESSDFVHAYSNATQSDRGIKAANSVDPVCTDVFFGDGVSTEQSPHRIDEKPDIRPRVQNRQLATGGIYSVIELSFDGPVQTPTDTPSRDISFSVHFQHESGTQLHVLGFWDGDGQGGSVGDQFKVRFTPTEIGRWELVDVQSNNPKLDNQHEGDYVVATDSELKGFWVPEVNGQNHSWYRRSDGSHQYIVGNTHYTFLSEHDRRGNPSGGDIVSDIMGNAEYFNKLRFSLLGDIAPHPTDKPFFTDEGKPTDSGIYAHRPNPAWFHQRADLAVETAFEHDLIADLIISGVANAGSRRVLFDCKEVQADSCERPWKSESSYLEYVAARYGSFPNVWMTVVNEWDLLPPIYEPSEIVEYGTELKENLAYPIPLSVHGSPGPWDSALDGPWHDHVIIQRKMKTWLNSFRVTIGNQQPRPMPIINDELSYQGAGDGHLEQDTIQAFVGAFVGGGYASTGYKSAPRTGQYVSGNFSVEEHSSADNLKWLREQIDQDIRFWEMDPLVIQDTVFEVSSWGVGAALVSDSQYFVATHKNTGRIHIELDGGEWTIEQWDVHAMQRTILESDYVGRFTFHPESGDNIYFFTREQVPTTVGDVNFDGVFNSSDLVAVFTAAKYELPKNDPRAAATYAEGDWNGDGYFTTSDLVYAFQNGRYSI